MATVGEQIQAADEAICRNIELLADQRALLSQNILSQLRNLVEGVALRLHTGSPDTEFNYAAIEPGLAFVKSKAGFNFLGKFHRMIKVGASHYTLDGDASERLMLKYYEYLYRIRSLLKTICGVRVLANLEDFPVDLDPSLREYHEKIAARIEAARSVRSDRNAKDRYYIHKTRPFFVSGRVYYEVTFYRAINKVSKFDRIIAFTDIDMTDKYAANLTLWRDSIEVLGQTMPITVIRKWEVSIRPCEFDNFARLLGMSITVRTNAKEYRYLMRGLTAGSGSLLDLIDIPDDKYATVRAAGTADVAMPQVFLVLDEARRIVRLAAPGQNVLRYLMLRMHNQILKPQYSWERCPRLSGMNLQFGCIPFDTMPFCTSLLGHNPRYGDLVDSLDVTERKHELLARRVKNNVERDGILYTPVADLKGFGDVEGLVSTYNSKLYYKHTERWLDVDKKHVFIRGYENETVSIVEKLQTYASSRIDGYTRAVEHWLGETPRSIDDPAKKVALKQLFSKSRVALIYGAAGTGKSTMVDHIAHYFNDKEKLFLAHTNPAIDNLKRRVTAQNADFRTISSHIGRRASGVEYDLLVIDECSTVSNADMIKVLEKTSFKLLVLVGDIYQIESINFGNWFEIIRSFIPSTSVFELTTPFRTKNTSLLRMGGSTVRFSVYETDTSDEDDDSLNTTVPFQVAYAVSIHKAQGLEYDSVKIVITDANEDDITHSIFYTAVTRARERLRIFWTPEAQHRVLQHLHRSANPKDVALLASRRGLTPVNG